MASKPRFNDPDDAPIDYNEMVEAEEKLTAVARTAEWSIRFSSTRSSTRLIAQTRKATTKSTPENCSPKRVGTKNPTGKKDTQTLTMFDWMTDSTAQKKLANASHVYMCDDLEVARMYDDGSGGPTYPGLYGFTYARERLRQNVDPFEFFGDIRFACMALPDRKRKMARVNNRHKTCAHVRKRPNRCRKSENTSGK